MKIISSQMNQNRIQLQTDAGLICIRAITPNIFHLRATLEDHFNEVPSLAVLPQDSEEVPCSLSETASGLVFSTPELGLTIDLETCAFTWKDAHGKLLLRQPAEVGIELKEIQVANSGQPPIRQPRPAVSAKVAFQFSPGEAIYGLGQHEEGILNYRGHTQYLYQNNMKIAMPVLVSSRGWGMFFDSYSLGVFHDDTHGSYYFCDTEDELDLYFLYGPSFDRIVAGFRRLTGAPSMLPRWAYGYLQSKERYKDQKELVEIVKQYRRRRIPLDGIIQDWQYWDEGEWGRKKFDDERFPDPTGLMEELHSLNAHAMISVWPNFGEVPEKQPFSERGLLLPDNQFYNAFDPAARELQWQQMNEGIFKHGFDGWWCDSSEPYDGQFFYEGRYRPEPWERTALNKAEFSKIIDPEFINAYSLLHAQGVYAGQRAATTEKRVVNLTRSAFPGQQRYGTITWSGDTAANWETLRWHIPAGLNVTVTGFPNWTLDIGGFFVRDNRQKFWWYAGDFPEGTDDLGFRELYVRWFQYAAFLPMFRSHGTDIDREIYRFGKYNEPFQEALIKFDMLRYRLIPYLYSLAAWENQRGYTMLRMLAFDFPEDERACNLTDQFMLGPALLVCPVTEPMYYAKGSQKLDGVPKVRRVYLPEGCRWYDFWTGECYAGGQEITAAAPLEILPLFVRAGSILSLGPVVMHTQEKLDAALEVRVYPGADASFDFYEDEGDSYRYEQGACAWTRLTWDDAARQLQVGERQGSYPQMPGKRPFDLVLVSQGQGLGVHEAGLDTRRAIDQVLVQAQQSSKLALLVFSASWCPDCLALQSFFDDPVVKPFLDEHFLVIKIDVYTRFTNRAVVEGYGSPNARGIPAALVLDGLGNELASTRSGEWSDARSATPENILETLQQWVDLWVKNQKVERSNDE